VVSSNLGNTAITGPIQGAHTIVLDAVYFDVVVLAVGRKGDVMEQRAQCVGVGTEACCCWGCCWGCC